MANANPNDVKAKTAGKTVGNTGIAGKDGLPDFANWSREQIGFAPYWNPEAGKFFYGTLIARDERDPEFVRYLVQAHMDHDCQRGPSENAEKVHVKKGESFSISVYHSLRDPFDTYLLFGQVTGKDVPVKCDALEKVPTKTSGRNVWRFDVLIPPESRKELDVFRAQPIVKRALANHGHVALLTAEDVRRGHILGEGTGDDRDAASDE